jgi:hypothetical protein
MSLNLQDIVATEIEAQPLFQELPNEGQRFVAWYVHRILGASPMDAIDSLTDGPYDKQIDAVHIDHDFKRVSIIQGKYYSSGTVTGEGVRECLAAVELLQDLDYLQSVANAKLQKKVNAIASALRDDYELIVEIVTTGDIVKNAREDAYAFQQILANKGLDVEIVPVDRRVLEDRYLEAAEQTLPRINHDFALSRARLLEFTENDTRGLLALFPLVEALEIPGIDNGMLFRKNVRQALSRSTKVNAGLRSTIRSEDIADFFFYHNGITALCDRFQVDRDRGQLHTIGLNVVNGCQSLTTLFNNSEQVRVHDKGSILFRFYEIEARGRADRISTFTNSQNAVKSRDLMSNHPVQLRLKVRVEGLAPSVFFSTKRGEVAPPGKRQLDSLIYARLSASWELAMPHVAHSEERLFDRYFNAIFRDEVDPADVIGLFDGFDALNSAWDDPTFNLRPELRLKRYHAPYHVIAAMAAAVSLASGQDKLVPRGRVLSELGKINYLRPLADAAASAVEQAFEEANEDATRRGEIFSPDNWLKSRPAVDAARNNARGYLKVVRTMDKKLASALSRSAGEFYKPGVADE